MSRGLLILVTIQKRLRLPAILRIHGVVPPEVGIECGPVEEISEPIRSARSSVSMTSASNSEQTGSVVEIQPFRVRIAQ